MEYTSSTSDQTTETPKTKALTAREKAVYEAILNHWYQHAVPPNIRDIMNVTNITSTSMVRFYYQKLVKYKMLKMIFHHPVPTEISNLIKKEPLQ